MKNIIFLGFVTLFAISIKMAYISPKFCFDSTSCCILAKIKIEFLIIVINQKKKKKSYKVLTISGFNVWAKRHTIHL